MPTCFEIYETYQRGPAAVLRLFEEALGTRAIYGQCSMKGACQEKTSPTPAASALFFGSQPSTCRAGEETCQSG
jgi:hypothetical protein